MNQYYRIAAEIDLEAIKTNIVNIKHHIPEDVRIMSVVKADGYGHGALEVAAAIDDCTDAYAVATIEEAGELRKAGINKPVLILGTLSLHHYKEAVSNDISVNVYTDDMAKALSDVASDLGQNAKIHIAVDTGMNRIGLDCGTDGLELVKKIASYPSLVIEGVFSHFATADETDKTTAIVQRDKFDSFCKSLSENGIDTGYRHICNSAAIIDLKENCYSMVRPGIILYGLYPSDEVAKNISLKPAMQLKSHVAYIKKVPAGEGISYGHTCVTDSERIIATIPVGYADGYPRLLSGKGRVIINGKYAPIVGRICMDQFMVDITGIEGVTPEDTVTLMGTDGDCTISADEIANLCGTINYEIVCGISKRVPRIYKHL